MFAWHFFQTAITHSIPIRFLSFVRWPPFILCLLFGKNNHIISFPTDVPVLVINLFQHKDNHICSHSQHPIALLWYGIITVNMFWIIEILFAFFTSLYSDTTLVILSYHQDHGSARSGHQNQLILLEIQGFQIFLILWWIFRNFPTSSLSCKNRNVKNW